MLRMLPDTRLSRDVAIAIAVVVAAGLLLPCRTVAAGTVRPPVRTRAAIFATV